MIPRFLSSIFVIVLVFLPSIVRGQPVTVYKNTTNSLSATVLNGGSDIDIVITYTRMVADDIVFSASAPVGYFINGFTYSVANQNAVAVSVDILASFYQNTLSGVPGTLIASYLTQNVSLPANQVVLIHKPIVAGYTFVVPAPGTRIWAGISFQVKDPSPEAILQLDNLGQALYAPPTIGSSLDQYFLSSAVNVGNTSNPPGTVTSFGGNPVADFGWEFTATPVPEPMTWAMIGLGIAGTIGYFIRTYRNRRTVMNQDVPDLVEDAQTTY